MIAVLQRVSSASVSINSQLRASIGAGFLVLLGIAVDDGPDDADYLAAKLASIRIFGDEQGLMNLSISQINGEFLVISQFTLLAATRKGNRPSFLAAAKPESAIPLYNLFVELLKQKAGVAVKTGEFGADMQVSLVNDGPVTIILDTKNKGL